MWLYDALAAFRNVHLHRWLSSKKVASLEPRLRSKGLKGAALYYDAQVDDARLTLATVRAAAQAGAVVANYAEATSLLKSDERVRGAVVRDRLTGETCTVRALIVVNATGPWTDTLRRRDEPDVTPLLRMTRGAHVVVPRARLGHTHAVTLASPIDGRIMFVLPWGDLTYVGTTDTDDGGPPADVRATGPDVVYLLRSANALFPDARLTARDVISTWAGLRALLAPDGNRSASQVPREHRVVEAASGMITIAGGKLTTYRRMAREVVDHVARALHELDGRPAPRRAPTDQVALPGGEAADLEVLVHSLGQRDVPEPQARHLVAYYGSEAAAVRNLAERDRTLDEPILAGRPEIWAEVAYAVEREMAVRLADVLIRRLHLFYEDPAHGSTVSTPVAHRMAELLGWDQTRRDEEIADYTQQVRRARAFLKEVPRLSSPGPA
jgi:glycerol-3-phosphate dehydrogenase